jgi:uncharacterized lipoprotein YddW (UPF0748 family)
MKRLSAGLLLCLVLPLPAAWDLAGAEEAQQVRAAWVTRWAYRSPDDVRRIMGDLDRTGVNTVFFQVRGACDALYESSLEPWSGLLAGRLGKDPGWDPLDAAIREGLHLGVEVHAWVNVFTCWPTTNEGKPPPQSSPGHVFHQHPGWLARDEAGDPMPLKNSESKHSYAFLSPTHPLVQDHISAVIADLVERYPVDGLHLDYIRFPDSAYSYDLPSLTAYHQAVRDTVMSFAEWRRRQLNAFVQRISGEVRSLRPGITVSAAVWQKVGTGRDVYLQDGIAWANLGYLDYIVPMFYTADPDTLRRRLDAHLKLTDPDLVVAGLGPYLEAFTDSILAEEVDAVLKRDVRGCAVFNSDYAVKFSQVLKRGWLGGR